MDEARVQRAEAERELALVKRRLEKLNAERLNDEHNDSEAIAELRSRLRQTERQLTSLRASYSTVLAELSDALEEIGRLGEGLPSVQSRAFAVSLIADARVRMQALPSPAADLDERRQNAQLLLVQADKALLEENYGAASYLAQKARETIRTTRVPVGRVEPLDEPLQLAVISAANLRSGPGTDHRRLGRADQGDRLTALAKMDEWYQVQNDGGLLAWIHRSLVTPP